MTFVSWFAAVAVSFVLIRLVPGDPVEVFLNHVNVRITDAVVADYRQQWGLDKSLPVQFALWLRGFLTLDWGISFSTGGAVSDELVQRLGWSATIGICGVFGAVLIGSALGFFAAANPGGPIDMISRGMAIAGQALPAFAVGVIALWLFAAELRWIQPFSGGTFERLVLPTGLVIFFSVGSISRLVRAGFQETVEAPYLKTAIAKGLGFRKALWRHGRRRAAIGLLAGIAPDLAWIVGGTAVAEIVFGVPGVSERVIEAVAARDYPILQAYVALVALWIIVGLQLCTFLRQALDPRVHTVGFAR